MYPSCPLASQIRTIYQCCIAAGAASRKIAPLLRNIFKLTKTRIVSKLPHSSSARRMVPEIERLALQQNAEVRARRTFCWVLYVVLTHALSALCAQSRCYWSVRIGLRMYTFSGMDEASLQGVG